MGSLKIDYQLEGGQLLNGQIGRLCAIEDLSDVNVDHRHRLLLRTRGVRQGRRASEDENQLPPPHSITASARPRIDWGTVRPSAFAVLGLMTSFNVVGCCTGRSAGLAPFRILPA